VQEGSNDYDGLYQVTYWGPDFAKPLKADMDISHRISGKNLTVKTPDGHEIKARLCERAGNAINCGNDTFTHFN
jgi:hypothetical protein